VERLVEPGEIDRDHVVTRGIFVRHIFQGTSYEKRIEKRVVVPPATRQLAASG
jgi:hypothetical protein